MKLSASFLVWYCTNHAVSAFSRPSVWASHKSMIASSSPSSLFMSDTFDDDELSKLIGKRDQIKRKKKAPEPEISDDDLLSAPTAGDALDFDKMPEFKTKRTSRAPRKSSSDEKEDKKKEQESAEKFVDFLSEYEDENDFHIPNRIGFTTSAWGDATKGFVEGGKLTKKMKREGKFLAGDLQIAYNTLMESGVPLVETSELYGSNNRKSKLSAQQILARCMEENTDFTPLVTDTFEGSLSKVLANGGVRFGSGSVVKALENSLARLDQSTIELYQVDSALIYLGGKSSLAKGLAQCLDKGHCNYVGVKNMGKNGVKSMVKKMEKQGYTLTSNQFEFSLTNRKAWKSDLIDTCKELGVIPLVRNPLDGGLATGKYTATNPSGGEAGGMAKFKFETLEKLQPLHSVQETVAEKARNRVQREWRDLKDQYRRYGPPPKINTDITTTQVAINYVIAKGAVPLVDITDPKQAEELLGCLGWGLSDEEVDMLDGAASLCGY
mmetsp:Transcript_16220/g.22864  ORF Transcript_16220/g.22864 Transcript_16220/m.22864 type:complete len:495 (+) Transcript_16220:144-1628(+)